MFAIIYQEPKKLAELQLGVRNFCGDFNARNKKNEVIFSHLLIYLLIFFLFTLFRYFWQYLSQRRVSPDRQFTTKGWTVKRQICALAHLGARRSYTRKSEAWAA